MSTPEALPCPACGSDSNERDELIKAEREIERLTVERDELRKKVSHLRQRPTSVEAALCRDERDALLADLRGSAHDHTPTEFLLGWTSAAKQLLRFHEQRARAALAQGKEPSNG